MAAFDWMSAGGCAQNVTGADNVASIGCLEPLFQNVVSAIMALVGVGLFVMLLVGGFNFLFAGGDQKKLEKAKTTLTGALGGIVVVVLAYLILVALGEITGLGTLLTTFKINIAP